MSRFETLTDALAAQDDQRIGLGLVQESGGIDQVPYPDLRERAEGYLSYLQEQGVSRGDELVIAFRSPGNLIVSYWAALLGGIVPVPLATPKSDDELEKLRNVWGILASPWLALDDASVLERLQEGPESDPFASGTATPRMLVSEDCSALRGSSPARVVPASPDDVAFVQFSSGSTGSPKGVTLTHRNLLTNAYDIIEASSITADDVFLSWKPLSHDFGMIAFHITPLVAGCHQYRMTTKHFIWNATDWLVQASRVGATVLGTPNFGVQHLLNRFDAERADREALDLSAVRMVWNAAEMINAELCADFVRTLAPYSLREDVFRPGYGLAENTLVVSVVREGQRLETVVVDRNHLSVGERVAVLATDVETDPNALELVLCGEPCTHSEVRIVDDAGRPVPEGVVGHVHVRGDCVTLGYYRNTAASGEILLDDDWMNTQDLAFLHRGQIVIVGRLKDVIIIGGVNYHPNDIENVILRGVGNARLNQFVACAIPGAETNSDELAVFVQHRGSAEQFSEVEREVRRLVMTGLGLTVEHVVPVRSIPRTTSGKVQRFRLVRDHLAATRPAAAPASDTPPAAPAAPARATPAADDVTRAVLAVVADFVTLPPDGRGRSLFELGCNSLQLISLQEALQKRLGLTLESTFVLDHPTVDDMVATLSGRLAGGGPVDAALPVTPTLRHPDASDNEPIAIVGMGFRLPGDLRTEAALWAALDRGADCVGPLPSGRWRHSPLDRSTLTTTQGGYLSDVAGFDPLLFRISPTEAESLDPQHRLLLELTWEALEDAGLDPLTVGAQRPVGVVVGISSHDYLQVARDLGREPEAYSYTGGLSNAAAGRLSYTFGLRGPCMSVDTACSSSLYAVHHAVRELRHGTCDVALAAGVNLILSPEGHASFARLGALAASGRCRSFDDSADGYVRSEGGAVVVLKRLVDAERDGDEVLAVVRGTAVNHNGHSGGFTVPSGEAQAGVVRAALANAGLTPADITYVEAHGSGTPIGDPQEINALATVFAGREEKVLVGSIKSNLGHLEAAAGMAGLCKVIVSLRARHIPGTAHLHRPNHLVDWDRVPLEVRADTTAWPPAADGRRRAGISSFGISGSNAHIVVEEHVHHVVEDAVGVAEGPQLLRLSAGSPAALEAAAAGVAAWSGSGVSLPDLAASLTVRPVLAHRAAVVCDSVRDVPERVAAAAADSRHVPGSAAPVAFVLPGQGSHYPGMTSGLHRASPAFREELERIDEVLSDAAGFPVVKTMLTGDAEAFDSPRLTQPMIFAAELALARHWVALGVRPHLVLGHSIGEYAAACFAGVLSLEDASAMVSARGRIMADAPQVGHMAALLCPLSEAVELVEAFEGVHVAAVNGAQNVTIGGLTEAMHALRREARKRRIFVEALPISHPFHTPLMADGAARLADEIAGVGFGQPEVPWVSAQTGRLVDSDTIVDAAYWARHLTSPVRFADAVATARSLGHDTFLETGAMATLGGLIAQDHPDTVALPSLRKGRDDQHQFLQTAGELWKLGHPVEDSLLPGGRAGRRRRGLPHTPMDRRPIWYPTPTEETPVSHHEARPSDDHRAADRDRVLSFLTQSLKQITGVAPDQLSGSVELFSLGMDSLMLVQLGRRLEKEFSIEIPVKTFFESLHTLDAVVEHVVGVMPQPEQAASVAAASVPAEAPLVPAVAPAASADRAVAPAASGGVEAIVAAQLRLMEQQLVALRGGAGIAAPVASASAPAVEAVPVPQALAAAAPAERRVGTYGNNIELVDENLTERQEQFLTGFVADFIDRTHTSKEYTERHRRTLADWIASLNYSPSLRSVTYPVVSSRSAGAHFWDLDGNRYLDTAMGYGVHFFGHQPDFVVDAVRRQLDLGFELGPQNRDAGEVAALVAELTGVERVAFCNTGSEAVMVALRLARTATGRDRIAKFVTSFHGSFDGVLAEADGEGTVPMTVGTPQSMVEDTVVLTYGSDEALRYVEEHGHTLAAVLVEPVQSRNPGLQPREFLVRLRELCTGRGIALVFDEMITGFRIRLGGAQEYFGVRADLVLYGKLIGGGMPIGVVAGSARFLDAVDGGAWSDGDDSRPAAETTFFAGTFCKHPLTMAACRAVLTHLKDHGAAEIARVNDLTASFVERANAWFEEAAVPLRAVCFGSLYRFESLVAAEMRTFALELNVLFRIMAARGVYVWERRTAFFSTAHTEHDADTILAALRSGVDDLRSGGFSFRRAGREVPVPAQPAPAAGALSSQEKRVYVLSRMRGGNEAYQILGAQRFESPLPDEALDAAFAAIAARHDKLRTRYAIEGSEVVSAVEATVVPDRVRLGEGHSLSSDEVVTAISAPFDLGRAPLWRYGTLVDDAGQQLLLVSFHHLVADGTSVELILDDLGRALSGADLEPVASQSYAAFVAQQARQGDHPSVAESRRWWQDQFRTLPEPLAIPTDGPRPEVNDFAGGFRSIQFDDALREAAGALVRSSRTTPFVFHLTCWAILLGAVSGSRDVCVGVPFDQRAIGDFEETVGMFAQSLPLRIALEPETRVRDLVAEVGALSLAAVDHSDYSYDELVRDLDVPRDFGRNALFDVMFTFTNAARRTADFGGVRGTTEHVPAPYAMFDLSLELTERDGHLFADLNHAAIFSPERADSLLAGLVAVLEQVVADPDIRVGDVSLVRTAQRKRLLALGTGPEPEVPPLWQLLDDACTQHADAVAIQFPDGRLTYRELSDLADRHAALLRREGVGVGDRVALILPRGPELVVWMLACQRAGCAWLLMDVNNPLSRLNDMLDTASPRRVVCSDELAEGLELGERALVVRAEDLSEPDGAAAAHPGPEELAYVIFTSGSTGRPKGVQLTNRALANFLVGMPDALRWAPGKRVANLTTPSFDIYLLETLLTISRGGVVVLGDEAAGSSPAAIESLVVGGHVDYLQVTPTRLRLLLADPAAAHRTLAALEKLIVGGEAFPPDLLDTLRRHVGLEVFNVYGPTETCIWSSVKDLTGATEVTIGEPIANTTVYVLDDDLRLVPEGTVGNLWIGGLGVSPGYLNRPDLDEGLFRDNPFGTGRIYLTGDRAQWVDGGLHCLGRIDNQVKIRGYRVELEEIEGVLASHPAVTSAAVVVETSGAGNTVLRGFVQAAPGARPEPQELRSWLAGRLSEYMVPATIATVTAIPMTTSGKVDRRALLAAEPLALPAESAAGPTSTEGRVEEAWRTILGDIPMGRSDSFFDLGGNSFSIVLLLTELNRAFGEILDVSDLFAHATIATQAAHVDALLRSSAPTPAIGVDAPAGWLAHGQESDGRVEADLTGLTLAALDALGKSTGGRAPLAGAVFALSLSRTLGVDEVTLGLVRRDEVQPVRFDFAERADLTEVLDDVHEQVRPEAALALDDLRAAGHDGRVGVAVTTEPADSGRLLRHFDLVFGLADTRDGVRVHIDHGRRVDADAMASQLGLFVKLLEVLGDRREPAATTSTNGKRNA